MIRLVGFIFTLIVCLILGFQFNSLAYFGDTFGIAPTLNWKTIETDHFRVSYPVELSEIARESTKHLEEAHSVLSPIFLWESRAKVQVLIVDNADSANGMAAATIRFGLMLIVTPPDNWSSIGNYDDWLRMLVFHEYTHFLNMDVTTDFYVPLRYIFGDSILPNSIWPMWMIEGMAVWMETRHTQVGRGRSPYYEMILRAAVDEGIFGLDDWVTLSKIDSGRPYFPGGATPYFFGYQLMNKVAMKTYLSEKSDAENAAIAEKTLGKISYNSGGRVPFFINGNLEKIIGTDWYWVWSEWASETSKRVRAQLNKIRLQPATRFRRITTDGYSVLGVSGSKDGKWLAYSKDSLHERLGLYLYDVSKKESRKVTDKIGGIGISFSPDSKFVFFDSLNRYAQYNLYSDLYVYDVENDSAYSISHGLRAKSPDVAPDGKQIVFTVSNGGSTHLALADLLHTDGEFKLGSIKIIFNAGFLGRVSTPKFSHGGDSVVFTLHKNGQTHEDLMKINLSSKSLITLVSNGKHNRYPTYDSRGNLFFVSDISGVENIYAYSEGGKLRQVTNMLTGIWFPTFISEKLYAGVFSSNGWDLAEIEITDKNINTASVTILPPPAPVASDTSRYKLLDTSLLKEEDYSEIPSIFPRAWSPFFLFNQYSFFPGLTASGFDAVDRHRYMLGLGYQLSAKKLDGYFTYENRSFGPTFSFYSWLLTTPTGGGDYFREFLFSGGVSYPFRWTYSSLVPFFSVERKTYTINEDDVTGLLKDAPSITTGANFSNSEYSKLSIAPEGGRNTRFGVRKFFGNLPSFKVAFSDREYFKLGSSHIVLSPMLQGVWTNKYVRGNLNRNVVLRSGSGFSDLVPSTGLDWIRIRGYSGSIISTKEAYLAALDTRIPILRLFRGFGTNPLFLQNLYAVGFVESGLISQGSFSNMLSLPSVGAGMHLDSTVFIQLPLVCFLELHRGLKKSWGGGSELQFGISINGALF